MKVECVKEKIQEAVSKAEKVTGKHLTLPILSYIIFEATKESLIIKATNLDVGVEINVPCKVFEEGVVAVPGSVFSSLLSNLTNQKVVLETQEQTLLVSTETSSTTIKTVPHDDFPSIPKSSSQESFSVHSESFIEGIKSVWYAAAVSSMKPELSSVFVTHNEDNIIFVGTDSFRLAERHIRVKKIKDFPNILIPVKNIPDIIKILEGISEDVELYIAEDQMLIKTQDIELVSRLVDGSFPDYKQIIPAEKTTSVTVLKKDLLHGLKTANIFSNKFNQIHLMVNPEAKIFSCDTQNTDVGENTTHIDAVLKGDTVELNFNYKYIVDCFQSVDGDSVALDFNGSNKPVVIRDISNPLFLYLVMPMSR